MLAGSLAYVLRNTRLWNNLDPYEFEDINDSPRVTRGCLVLVLGQDAFTGECLVLVPNVCRIGLISGECLSEDT